MPRNPTTRKWIAARGGKRLLASMLLLALCVGCVTGPSPRETQVRRALRPMPKVRAEPLRADQALVAAFSPPTASPSRPKR